MAEKKDADEKVSTPMEKEIVEEKAVAKTKSASKTAKTSKTPAKKKAVAAKTTTARKPKATVTAAPATASEPTEPAPQEQTESNAPETAREEETAEKVEELSIEEKLLSLYHLQQICTKIDKIRMIRGELPEEIRDKEDECEGKRTRIAKFNDDILTLKNKISSENTKKEEAAQTIRKYEEQQNHVRNNREYESLSKEIEYQNLEIQISDKHKEKYEAEILEKEEQIAQTTEKLTELEDILKQKKAELDVIIADTEKEEKELLIKTDALKAKIDDRLLAAFERIRKNAHNGLAIVQIERDACGGCFSKIPPQRQLDIRLHKKIIVCEACGRIFIDHQLVESKS